MATSSAKSCLPEGKEKGNESSERDLRVAAPEGRRKRIWGRERMRGWPETETETERFRWRVAGEAEKGKVRANERRGRGMQRR